MPTTFLSYKKINPRRLPKDGMTEYRLRKKLSEIDPTRKPDHHKGKIWSKIFFNAFFWNESLYILKMPKKDNSILNGPPPSRTRTRSPMGHDFDNLALLLNRWSD